MLPLVANTCSIWRRSTSQATSAARALVTSIPCHDTTPDEKRAQKAAQHAALAALLQNHGLKVEFGQSTHRIPLGHCSSVYTCLGELMTELKVSEGQTKKLCRKLGRVWPTQSYAPDASLKVRWRPTRDRPGPLGGGLQVARQQQQASRGSGGRGTKGVTIISVREVPDGS